MRKIKRKRLYTSIILPYVKNKNIYIKNSNIQIDEDYKYSHKIHNTLLVNFVKKFFISKI